MNRLLSIRATDWRSAIFAAMLLYCGVPHVPAQTATTSAPGGARQAVPSVLKVDYTGGKLSVNASNASLNQILQEIAGKTGMKLSGGVSEERVFGQYGPSSPSVVLASLLDGTGSNMLLVDSPKGPAELILTPRTGGPTPPAPHPTPEEHASETPAEPPPPPPMPPPTTTQQVIRHRGIGHPPTPGSLPETTPEGNAPNADGAGSPNGIKTPQQINEQQPQMNQ